MMLPSDSGKGNDNAGTTGEKTFNDFRSSGISEHQDKDHVIFLSPFDDSDPVLFSYKLPDPLSIIPSVLLWMRILNETFSRSWSL